MAGIPSEPRAQLNEVVRLCQIGAFDDAENLCRSITRSHPRLADAWNLLATILQQLEQHEQSLDAAKQATSLRSNLPPYWLTRGNAEITLGQFAAAVKSLSRATKLSPNFAEAHFRLGVCRAAQGRNKDAIASYREALRFAPEIAELHYRLGEALMNDLQWGAAAQFFQAAFVRDQQAELDRQPGITCLRHLVPASIPPFWRGELLHFLQRRDVNKSRFVDIVIRVLKATPPLNAAIGTLAGPTGPEGLPAVEMHDIMNDGLLSLLLCEGVVNDPVLESFLTWIRSRILLDAHFREKAPHAFVCALAVQCFNNEFVFAESADESALADSLLEEVRAQRSCANPKRDAHAISVVAMYRPIHDLPGIDRLPANAANPVWGMLVKKAVHDVLTERSERSRIGALGQIDDDTSRAVRQMYEENPYPRWFSLDQYAPVSLDDWIANPVSMIASPNPSADTVRILVAGCGTGKEACELALDIANAQVLAVDLSLSSLAFARRTARELGIDNIEFRQADLLNLETAGEAFDLVSSSGVIHHMKHPEEGLAALARQVRPGGYLRVALYSERARAIVNLARQYVKDHQIRSDPAGIREFRRHVRGLPEDAPLKRLTRWFDFYSLSTCRDLVFHVMEHQYRLPQIESMLRDAGLIPVDLVQGLEPDVLAEFKRRFPQDNAMTSFANWEAFEEAFPNTFMHMFSIRARKPKSDAG